MWHAISISPLTFVEIVLATVVVQVICGAAFRVLARRILGAEALFPMALVYPRTYSDAGLLAGHAALPQVLLRASFPGVYKACRIILGNNPEDWVVNDIKVGNESQLAQSGDLPGEMFSSTMVDGFVNFDRGREISILATYIGAHASSDLWGVEQCKTEVVGAHDMGADPAPIQPPALIGSVRAMRWGLIQRIVRGAQRVLGVGEGKAGVWSS